MLWHVAPALHTHTHTQSASPTPNIKGTCGIPGQSGAHPVKRHMGQDRPTAHDVGSWLPQDRPPIPMSFGWWWDRFTENSSIYGYVQGKAKCCPMLGPLMMCWVLLQFSTLPPSTFPLGPLSNPGCGRNSSGKAKIDALQPSAA